MSSPQEEQVPLYVEIALRHGEVIGNPWPLLVTRNATATQVAIAAIKSFAKKQSEKLPSFGVTSLMVRAKNSPVDPKNSICADYAVLPMMELLKCEVARLVLDCDTIRPNTKKLLVCVPKVKTESSIVQLPPALCQPHDSQAAKERNVERRAKEEAEEDDRGMTFPASHAELDQGGGSAGDVLESPEREDVTPGNRLSDQQQQTEMPQGNDDEDAQPEPVTSNGLARGQEADAYFDPDYEGDPDAKLRRANKRRRLEELAQNGPRVRVPRPPKEKKEKQPAKEKEPWAYLPTEDDEEDAVPDDADWQTVHELAEGSLGAGPAFGKCFPPNFSNDVDKKRRQKQKRKDAAKEERWHAMSAQQREHFLQIRKGENGREPSEGADDASVEGTPNNYDDEDAQSREVSNEPVRTVVTKPADEEGRRTNPSVVVPNDAVNNTTKEAETLSRTLFTRPHPVLSSMWGKALQVLPPTGGYFPKAKGDE